MMIQTLLIQIKNNIIIRSFIENTLTDKLKDDESDGADIGGKLYAARRR